MQGIDWSACPDVERIPGKLSGQWLVKDTRIPAQTVLDHTEDGYSPEEIAHDLFPGMTADQARRIIAFARQHAPHPA